MKSFVLTLGLAFFFPAALHASLFEDYQAEQIFRRGLPEFGNNFSSVVYLEKTGHYLILDDTCRLFEVSIRNGNEIIPGNTVKLEGLNDCEAAAVLKEEKGTAQIAVTEEGLGNVAIFEWRAGQNAVPYEAMKVKHIDEVSTAIRRNAGLEAMAADLKNPEAPVLYAGKEEFPRKIYRVTLKNQEIEKNEVPWDAHEKLPRRSDLAEFAFFEGNLFVLNQRGDAVYEVDPETGARLSELRLPRTWITKYEGLWLRRLENDLIEMVIAAEDHWIYLYRLKKKA